jgi:hypothetical protein
MVKLMKSKEEKEMERRMQVKQGRRKAERHIANQKKQVQKYWDLAKKAMRLGDREILQKLVTLIAATRQDIQGWERRMLYFDMIEAMRDQALAGAEFAKSFQAMSESILANANPADLSAIQMNLERSMAVAEQLEDRLEDFQSSLDDMLSEAGGEERAEYKEILAMIQREAEQEPETAIDGEIEATMKQIEAMLGRKA